MSEEYIKKEDAIKAFEKSLLGKYILWDTQDKIKKDMQERISRLPTYSIPDSAENKGEDSKVTKGQWIKFENGYKCSECGHIMDTVLSVSGNLIYQYSNYCPECGKNMIPDPIRKENDT